MAQNIYQGTGGNPFGAYNPSPILAGGQAMGQAFQSIGTSIASAMEKRRENQEKKEKEELAALQFKGMAKANPDLAAQFGIDINDSGSLDVGAKAFAKNPNSMGLMQQFAQGAQAMQLAKRADERAGVSAESLEKMRQQQLKSGAIDLRIQQALQEGKLKLAKEMMDNKLMQAQEEGKFMKLGGGSAETLKKMEDLKVKGEILETENIQSQIDYRKAMTDYYEKLPGIEQMKANAKSIENAGYGKQSEALKKDWESLLGRRIKLHSGEHVKLEDYLDPTSEFGKNRKKYPITEDALGGIYGEMEGLRLRQDDLIQNVMVTVDDSDAGEGSVFDNIDSEILGMTRPQAAKHIGNKIDDAIKEKAAIQGKLDQKTLTIAQEKEARAAIQKLDKEIDQLGSSKYHVPDPLDQYPANYGSWMY